MPPIDENTDLAELPRKGLIRLDTEGNATWWHLSHNGATFKRRAYSDAGAVLLQRLEMAQLHQNLIGGTHLSYPEIGMLIQRPVDGIKVDNHQGWMGVINELEQLWPFELNAQPMNANSRRTRVIPVFTWLTQNAGESWPQQLLSHSQGLAAIPDIGPVQSCQHTPEIRVSASPLRLAWMLRNARLLVPHDGRNWQELRSRAAHPQREQWLALLDQGISNGLPGRLCFEGPTCCDCLIECERAIIWVEGKRNDWVATSTEWDVTRDQLARNLDAASIFAAEKGKPFVVLICYENELRQHENLLIAGYRQGTWTGGLPHLSSEARLDLGQRIATITWSHICEMWPGIILPV